MSATAEDRPRSDVPRILHLVSSERWTGVAEPATSVALLQQRMGCEVWLACVPSRSFEREAKRRGVDVVTKFYFSRRMNLYRLKRDVDHLRRFMAKKRIHVVHCHLTNDHWLASLARGRRPAEDGAILARTFHRNEPPYSDFAHRWLFCRQTDLAIVGSRPSEEQFADRLGLAPPRLRRIYGAVDSERFNPGLDGSAFRAELGIPAEAPLGGIVARMVQGRGHDWLLQACEAALERNPDLYITLIGRGPLKKEIRSRIAAHRFAERIIMAGYRKENLPQAFAALDFHILLREGSEGSCRAVLEAMACGKPSIVVRRGVLPETIEDGRTGLVISPGSAAELAESIVKLGSSRDRAKIMGQEARREIEKRFGEEIRAGQVLQAYGEVWNLRRPGIPFPSFSPLPIDAKMGAAL